jgi:hypothetical protein
MQVPGSGRKISAALLLFLIVYIAAFGLLFAPKGTFVSAPATAAATAP